MPATFGMPPGDMSAEQAFAQAAKFAREEIADYESGRRKLTEKQLRDCRRIVAEWGKYESTGESPGE